MHNPIKRPDPQDPENLELWESFSAGRFENYPIGELQRFAGAVALNAGLLCHSDPTIVQQAAINIALQLAWTLRAIAKGAQADYAHRLQCVGSLLDAFGVDRQGIARLMKKICDPTLVAKGLAFVGDDFFMTAPEPQTT